MKRRFLKNLIAMGLITGAVSSFNTVQAHAAWNKNDENKWAWTENGNKATGWKKIQGQWYYFNKDGAMATGWHKDNDGNWYYLNNSGAMATGWRKDNDGNWYYLNNSGAMATGWYKHNDGNWYYLNGSGAMATGWVKDNSGNWYYLNGSGAMVTGWHKDNNGNWYYLNGSGSMATGWLESNGKKYYFDGDGSMVTGKANIDGVVHKFNNSGELASVESVDNDASFIKEENRTAYIATDSCPLNLRDKPSMNSNIIGSIPKGMQVVVIGKEVNGFYKVEWDNQVGYISSSWVSFEKNNSSGSSSDKKEHNFGSSSNVQLGQMRTIAPSRDNKHYYSDSNLFYRAKLAPTFTNSSGKEIIGNCTWYTWGRIWELTGEAPTDADFRGNAYEWWEANKRTGKYKYGSTPKVGAVPVWKSSLPNSGGCGHVAVVEKIENGKAYISESSWHGALFKYRPIYDTEYLYGYIYIDEPNY